MITKPKRRHGLRGRALKRRREALHLGQIHVARVVGVLQSQLSYLENEVLGGLPRGKSAEIQDAMDLIVAGGSPHWPKNDGHRACGCERTVTG